MSRDQEHDPYRAAEGPYGTPHARAHDPWGEPSRPGAPAHDPYATADPYAGADPYASGDPYAVKDPYAVGDPYATARHGSAPHATDPLSADGSGPRFSSAAAPSGHLGVATSGAPVGGAPGDGTAGYGTAGYGAPGYGAVRPSSGSAIAGFVLGLLSIVMCSGLTSPVGIFLSAMGLRETGPTATPPRDGRGLAIAGMVLSLVGLIPLLVLLAYILLIVVAVLAETAG